MSKDEFRFETSPLDLTERNARYIEKKVNYLSAYSAYWCLFELRSLGELSLQDILKDDTHVKSKLINILKRKNCSPKFLDGILQVSADQSIPLSYVKWFYEDDRTTLWINMVLRKHGILNDYIRTKSDIAIFAHNLIFNTNLQLIGGIIDSNFDAYNDSLVLRKRQTLEFLQQAYNRSRIKLSETKWLDSCNDIQVNHLYIYMQKAHDLNNIYVNELNKKPGSYPKLALLVPSLNQALIYADKIMIEESDTDSRRDHMLASLDYWTFDNSRFDSEDITRKEYKIYSRSIFVKKMKDVCSSKASRIRDKKIKEKGLELTGKNKKALKLIAKKQGRTQVQMLNDIVESYDQASFLEVSKTTSAAAAYIAGNYGKRYDDSFETQQSLKAKQASSETILVHSDSEEITEDVPGTNILEPTAGIESENRKCVEYADIDECIKNDEQVKNAKPKDFDNRCKNLEDADNSATGKLTDELIIAITPSKNIGTPIDISTIETVQPVTSSHATEDISASVENLHNIDDKIYDNDPFLINARVIRQKVGRT